MDLSSVLEADGYPPSAFYFKVVFGPGLLVGDTSFQEVSGISSEITTEDITEGGENRFMHKLPKGVKHPNLELKRGIAPIDSPLVLWCKSVLDGDFSSSILTMPIMVYLMNEDKVPIRGWMFANAYPVKWDVESFGSTKNEVAIEKIILSYSYSNRLM